jgi:hypothetical protein
MSLKFHQVRESVQEVTYISQRGSNFSLHADNNGKYSAGVDNCHLSWRFMILKGNAGYLTSQ